MTIKFQTVKKNRIPSVLYKVVSATFEDFLENCKEEREKIVDYGFAGYLPNSESTDKQRAQYEMYIPRTRVPSLKREIKREMVFGKLQEILSKGSKQKPKSKFNRFKGYLVRKIPSGHYLEVDFYMPVPPKFDEDYSPSTIVNLICDTRGEVYTTSACSVSELMFRLKHSKEALVDKLRAEILREIINQHKGEK